MENTESYHTIKELTLGKTQIRVCIESIPTEDQVKRRLKVILTILLTIIIGLILGLIIKKGVDDFEELARQCDQDRGYTCSYYDIRQYSLGK